MGNKVKMIIKLNKALIPKDKINYNKYIITN